MRTGPLTSLKVIELCNVVAGPFAGSLLADWGADVIIGTHPHVIQPVELLTAAGTGKTVPIAYSLGNFVSTQAAANNMVGVIL